MIIAVSLWAASSAEAGHIYVAQNAVGRGDGSSATNARALTWLNSTANWGPGGGKVNPGDTVHLTGTLTDTITVAGSGLADNPVTLYFEPGAKISMPVVAGIKLRDGASWITIDGGSNGLIESTDNGTRLGHQAPAGGVFSPNAWVSHVTVKNLTITNLYRRDPFSADGNRYGTAIDVQGSDILILNNHVSEGDTLITASWGSGLAVSNFTILGNEVTRCNHGIIVPGNGNLPGATFFNLTIVSNRIYDLYPWVGNAGIHLDGIYLWLDQGSFRDSCLISNVVISHNTIGPHFSSPTNSAGTAGLFATWYSTTGSNCLDLQIYNNLFLASGPNDGWQDHWSNGYINITGAWGTRSLIANNTFIGYSGTNQWKMIVGHGLGIALTKDSPVLVANNLLYDIGAFIMHSDTSFTAPFNSDYNVIFDIDPTASGAAIVGSSQWGWMDWKRAEPIPGVRFDQHSNTNKPAMSGYAPATSDTVARGAGTNLASYFATDLYGSTRPAAGPWTVGAIETRSGGGAGGRPAPASNLRVQ